MSAPLHGNKYMQLINILFETKICNIIFLFSKFTAEKNPALIFWNVLKFPAIRALQKLKKEMTI